MQIYILLAFSCCGVMWPYLVESFCRIFRMLSPNWLVFALFHISARYSGFTFDIQLFGTGEGVMCFFILPVLL